MKIAILSNQAKSMAIFWRVLMQRLSASGHELLCITPPGDEASESRLRTMGAEVVNYHLNRKGLNPFQDISSFLALKNIFQSHRPDLVFASTIKPVIYGLLAAHQSGIPAAFATITGLGYAFENDSLFKKLVNRLGSFLYKISLRHATGIFFQNNDDKQLFLKSGIINENSPVRMARGTGVDTEHFSPVPLPPQCPSQALNFLFIGRLLEAKGLPEYVEAAARVKKKWPLASFRVLGPLEEGPGAISRERLEAWINDKAIEYLGSTTDVRPHIAQAHVVVLPSWREGTPTAIMEAMSMGRPCLVTDVPGCRELVRDGQNGYLCQARNPDDLARGMEKFLNSPAMLSIMGEKSRELAISLFDAKRVADGIIADMRELSPKEIWLPKEHKHD